MQHSCKYPKQRPAPYHATDPASHDSFDTPSIRSQRCTGKPLPRRAHACIPSACEPAATLLLMLSRHCSSHSQLRGPLQSLTGCQNPRASPQRPRQTCTHSATDLRHCNIPNDSMLHHKQMVLCTSFRDFVNGAQSTRRACLSLDHEQCTNCAFARRTSLILV